jgi:hypothetical protein
MITRRVNIQPMKNRSTSTINMEKAFQHTKRAVLGHAMVVTLFSLTFNFSRV